MQYSAHVEHSGRFVVQSVEHWRWFALFKGAVFGEYPPKVRSSPWHVSPRACTLFDCGVGRTGPGVVAAVLELHDRVPGLLDHLVLRGSRNSPSLLHTVVFEVTLRV